MTKYIQTNPEGYIVGITSEPLLSGLFDGSPRNFMEVEDDMAEAITPLLEAKHRCGEGLHISKLETIRKGFNASN